MRFPSSWKRFQTIRRKNGRFEWERNEPKEGKEKKLLMGSVGMTIISLWAWLLGESRTQYK